MLLSEQFLSKRSAALGVDSLVADGEIVQEAVIVSGSGVVRLAFPGDAWSVFRCCLLDCRREGVPAVVEG